MLTKKQYLVLSPLLFLLASTLTYEMRLRTSPNHPLCVFDIMGNHPTGETSLSCKIPARYLLSLVSDWFDQSRTTYVGFQHYFIIHLHTIIPHQYGSEDPYHTIGKNLIGIDGHLSTFRPRSYREANEYSYRRLTPGRPPGPDSVLILRGDVEGFWSVPAMYRVPRWKVALISGETVYSLCLFQCCNQFYCP